jgi:hypothetical protein
VTTLIEHGLTWKRRQRTITTWHPTAPLTPSTSKHGEIVETRTAALSGVAVADGGQLQIDDGCRQRAL